METNVPHPKITSRTALSFVLHNNTLEMSLKRYYHSSFCWRRALMISSHIPITHCFLTSLTTQDSAQIQKPYRLKRQAAEINTSNPLGSIFSLPKESCLEMSHPNTRRGRVATALACDSYPYTRFQVLTGLLGVTLGKSSYPALAAARKGKDNNMPEASLRQQKGWPVFRRQWKGPQSTQVDISTWWEGESYILSLWIASLTGLRLICPAWFKALEYSFPIQISG